MSEQMILQGKLVGIEDFLLAPAAEDECALAGGGEQHLLAGRSHWIALLAEVIPRALLAEFGLPRVLLGSSGGGQFLLVLPGDSCGPAGEFLGAAAQGIETMSRGHLKLTWAFTENLGDWSVVRRRLAEDLQHRLAALAVPGGELFEPFPCPSHADGYFPGLARQLWEAETVGWSPDSPARLALGASKHTWGLIPNRAPDTVTVARHMAPSDDGQSPADLPALAARAQGRALWGVLRGDADNFRIRLRRAQTIEEYVQLSVLYKQFFAGELEVLCSQPEFWRKVTILYSGGDDFAAYGAWDALIPLAREMQRLFHRFSEENLREFPGPEGKTISMALALAPDPAAALASVFQEAGRLLELAKAADKDCIYLLGRTLEWRQLADAAELKETLARMVGEFGSSRQVLNELSRFYRKGDLAWGQGGEHFEKPWRFQRRLNRVLAGARDREVHKLRAHLANEMMGRGAAQVKLRPAGLVALEWTRLITEV
ncbi:MAG: hypothetical protein AAB225_02970 [Acidobacteriota bacterium]